MTNTDHKLQQLLKTISALRSVDGCPWDKRQSPLSLIKYFRSELDELILAIEKNDTDNICEELGDLLYLVLMVCEIHKEQGLFTVTDMVTAITEKLVRRHPHVFEGTTYKDEAELVEQWNNIKEMEKKKKSI